MGFRRLLPYLITAFLLPAIFYSKPGRALEGDTWLGINGLSYHFKRTVDYNEQNNGLGFEHYVTDKWRVMAGHYENSYYRPSTYLGVTYSPWYWGKPETGFVSIGGAAWLVTGYEEGPVPIPFGVITAEYKRVGLNFGISPAVLMLQFKLKLD